MIHNFNEVLIKILHHSHNTPVGLGILISFSEIITCTHVIKHALGIDDQSINDSNTEIRFRLPLSRNDSKKKRVFTANIIKTKADICLLQVSNYQFDDVTFIPPLFSNTENIKIKVYGYPKDKNHGNNIGEFANGLITGISGNDLGLIQIDPLDNKALIIQQGFSGSPVINPDSSRWLGILRAIDSQYASKRRNAYMIPVDTIYNELNIIRENRISKKKYAESLYQYLSQLLLQNHYEYNSDLYIETPYKLNGEVSEIPLLKQAVNTINRNQFVLIHSGPGGGKSFLLNRCFNLYTQKLTTDDKTPYYMLINLKNLYTKNIDTLDDFINSLIELFIADWQINSKLKSLPSFYQIIMNHEKCIIALDGFDELMDMYSYNLDKQNQLLIYFNDLMNLGHTLLLACRSNYLYLYFWRNTNEGFLSYFSSRFIGFKMGQIELLNFTDNQIEQFIDAYGTLHLKTDRFTMKYQILDNFRSVNKDFQFLETDKVIELPLLAKMYLDVITRNYNVKDNLKKIYNLYSLYQEFILTWLQRGKNSNSKSLAEISQSYHELATIAKFKFLAPKCYDKKLNISHIITQLNININTTLIRGLLKLSRGDYIEFVHESFFSFLISDILIKEILSRNNNHNNNLDLWNYPMDKLILLFIAYYFFISNITLSEILLYYCAIYKQINNTENLSSSFLLILSQINKLRYIKNNKRIETCFDGSQNKLISTLLSEGLSRIENNQFYGSSFTEIQLNKLTIKNIQFKRCLFENCQINNVLFENCNFSDDHDGSYFSNCELNDVQFINCKFNDYRLSSTKNRLHNLCFKNCECLSSMLPEKKDQEVSYINCLGDSIF